MIDFIALLKAVASVIIPQSLYRFAKRIIDRSLRWVADAVAEVLRDYGFHRAARTVRHIARYLIDWGPQLFTFADSVYGAYEDYANVAEEVDEIEIEGYRYTLGGETYVY